MSLIHEIYGIISMAWLAFFTTFALYSFSIAVIFYDIYLDFYARGNRIRSQIAGIMSEPLEDDQCPTEERQKPDWKSEGF